jgi:hypothetical protein
MGIAGRRFACCPSYTDSLFKGCKRVENKTYPTLCKNAE